MLSQINASLTFDAFFTASKVGKTGLTVTVDVRNPAGTLVVTGGSATEVGGGFYTDTLASGSVTTAGNYRAVFKTTDSTVDAQHLPSLWIAGKIQDAALVSSGLDGVVVETGVNARQALSPILAAACGVLSGAPSGPIVVKGGNVATTRITATVDANGNRSVVTLSLPT